MWIVQDYQIHVLQKGVPVALVKYALQKHQIHVCLVLVDVASTQNASPGSSVKQEGA